MARQRTMLKFARWHIWLGWLVGFPILMWTVTGLVMIVRPLAEVRGDDVRAEHAAIPGEQVVLPKLEGPVHSVTLESFPDGPGWIVVGADGSRLRYAARDGSFYNPVDEDSVRAIAQAAYAGTARIEAMTYFPADSPPIDLRQKVHAWQARFTDGTNIYIASQTGEVLAVRTRWWRIYDLMWGLHIMDLETREDPHHPIIIVFAVLSTLGALLGCILMFRRRKARPA
ncbi:PepSY domain-containing protein [Tsuneonella sp. HG222]